jgi:hypothetical protein
LRGEQVALVKVVADSARPLPYHARRQNVYQVAVGVVVETGRAQFGIGGGD